MLKYKHDTTGMFKDISFAISKIVDLNFKGTESLEMFEMVHEAFLRMIKTSKELIRHSHEQEIVLRVVDSIEGPFKSVLIDSLNLKLDITENHIIYYYPVNENKEDLQLACGKLLALLPLKEVSVELKDKQMQVTIEAACNQSICNDLE